MWQTLWRREWGRWDCPRPIYPGGVSNNARWKLPPTYGSSKNFSVHWNINLTIPMVFNSLTRSSKMSLWCTWMVISVSNFVLTTLVSSLVVCSISTFNSSRNAVFVCCITFLSYLAFVRASVESRVHIIWIPSKPTYKQQGTVRKPVILVIHSRMFQGRTDGLTEGNSDSITGYPLQLGKSIFSS